MSAPPEPPAFVEPTDPALIERFARRDPALHLYELGDLDPFFWPHTRWFGWPGPDGGLAALALLYTGQQLPVLLALGRNDDGAIERLAEAIAPRLPPRLYAHLSPGVLARLGERFAPHPHGRYLKMELARRNRLGEEDHHGTVLLGPADEEEVRRFYAHAYPGNWFDPRMLETERYVGLREGGTLVCIAGVHVLSRAQRVAALGNVATAPARRGLGLARRATAVLSRRLLADGIEVIGLNVRADNEAAIACYRRLGFVPVADYDEVMLEPAPSSR